MTKPNLDHRRRNDLRLGMSLLLALTLFLNLPNPLRAQTSLNFVDEERFYRAYIDTNANPPLDSSWTIEAIFNNWTPTSSVINIIGCSPSTESFSFGLSEDGYPFVYNNETFYQTEEVAVTDEYSCLHLAVVYISDEDELQFYVDGQRTEAIYAPDLDIDGQDTWVVGDFDQLGSRSFVAGLEELRVWKYARSQTDVENNAYVATGWYYPDMFIYNPVNEGTWLELHDPYQYSSYFPFPSLDGFSNTYDPEWSQEDCLEDLVFDGGYRVGTSQVDCSPVADNLICNGDFEQYDPVLDTANVWFLYRHEVLRADGGGYSDVRGWHDDPNSNTGPNGMGVSDHIFFNVENSQYLDFMGINPWNYPASNNACIGIEHNWNPSTNQHAPAQNYFETELVSAMDTTLQYIFSFWGRCKESSSGLPRRGAIRVEFLDGGGTPHVLDTFNIDTASSTYANGWTHYSLSFRPTVYGLHALRIVPAIPDGLPSTFSEFYWNFFMDNFVLKPYEPIEDCFPQTIAFRTTVNSPYQNPMDNLSNREVATDDNGNTFVAVEYAYMFDTTIVGGLPYVITFGEDTAVIRTTYSQYGVVLAKYDTCGTLLWQQLLHSDGPVVLSELAVAPDGNIYLAGGFKGQLHSTSGCSSGSTSTNDFDTYLVKFSTSGVCQWMNTSNASSGDEILSDIVIEDNNTLFACGNKVSGLDPVYGALIPVGGSFVVKLTGLTSGTISPASIYPDADWVTQHIAKNVASVYTVGTFGTDSLVIHKFSKTNIASGPSATSAPIVSTETTSFPAQIVQDIAVRGGNVYLTGHYWRNIQFDGTASTTPSPSNLVQDFFTTHYARSGFIAHYDTQLDFEEALSVDPYVYTTADSITVLDSLTMWCVYPPGSCDTIVVVSSSPSCGGDTMYVCQYLSTIPNPSIIDYASGTVLLHEIAFNTTGDLLVTGLASSYNLGALGYDTTNGMQQVVIKTSDDLTPEWVNNANGNLQYQNYWFGRSTSIAAMPDETSFATCGNFIGNAKLFDVDTVSSYDSTMQTYVTRVYDLGNFSQFKNQPEPQALNPDRNDSYNLYPNPSNGILTISSGTSLEGLSVYISTLNGSRVLDVACPDASELSLPLFDLPAGLYLVQVISDTKVESYKWIKY